MESSQGRLQHERHLMRTNHEEAAYNSAPTLREITNHSSKHLHDQIERAGSGSLQRRDSNSAASGPDAQDSAIRDHVPQQGSPSGIQVLNIPELVKAAAAAAARAAEQDSGKHGQPDGQAQAPPPAAPAPDAQPSADRVPAPGQEPNSIHVPDLPELPRAEAAAKAAEQAPAKHGQPDGHTKAPPTAASAPDAQQSVGRVPAPRQEPNSVSELGIPELYRAETAAEAAEQAPGKPDARPLALLPDTMPQRTKPSYGGLSPVQAGLTMPLRTKPSYCRLSPLQAGLLVRAKHAQTSTVLDLTKHSSRRELLPAEGKDIAAQRGQGSEPTHGHAPRSKQLTSISAAYLHHTGGAQPDAGAATPAAVVKPQRSRPFEAVRAFQPPLSADPENSAAWDTPRLEQLPVKLPEPRAIAHVGPAALTSADPACNTGPAYDSPRAAQARGSEGVVIEESADGAWPAHVMVVCNSNVGKFLLVKQTMVCTCKLCQNKAAKMGVPFVDMTPTEFERHSGDSRAA